MKQTLLLFALVIPALLFAQQNVEKYGACVMRDGVISGVHENEFFAMHSIMKFPQALYVADYLKRNGLDLDDTIIVSKDELMQDTWSPMLRLFEGNKAFSYAELLELSLAQSDNNACDLLFKHCGSPKTVERYMRKLGFSDIHIRKTEKQMHKNPATAIRNNSTPGDVDDRKPLEYKAFVEFIYGKLVADKGYIGKNLFERLFVDGIQLITKLKNNMKGALMSVSDKLLLRKRAIIETVNDELKNIAQVEHSRHRCFDNFIVNILGALAAYCCFPKKPCINVQRTVETQLSLF